MKFGNDNLDILVQAYPGKSVCHGSLSWSRNVLLRVDFGAGQLDWAVKEPWGMSLVPELYTGEREGAIAAWTSETLGPLTVISLVT